MDAAAAVAADADDATHTTALERETTNLVAQFYALVPPYLLRIPSAPALRACQPALVRALTDGSAAGGERDPPLPEAGYRRGFWRRVVPAIEAAFDGIDCDEEDGVDSAIYEAIADAMAAPTAENGLPAPSPKTFFYHAPGASGASSSSKRVTLYEEQVAVQGGTTGLRTWTAALHFAHHFLQDAGALFSRPGMGPPRAVVELGAGTGFLSAVLAQNGVDVIATDLGDEGHEGREGDKDDKDQTAVETEVEGVVEETERQTPLSRLCANLAFNKLPTPVLPLDWTHASLPPADRPAAWSRVLAPYGTGVRARRRDIFAADVIYDPDIVPLLVSAIRVLLTEGVDEGGTEPEGRPVAVLAATVRNEATFALFLETCKRSGLSTLLLDLEPMDADAPTFWDTALDRGTRVQMVRIWSE